jgi:hypothetical protein
MATIALNTSKLPVTDKLVKGQIIITQSTSNPNVPGNTAALAAFTTAQEALQAANAAYETNRQAGTQLLTARENAVAAWSAALNGLAGITELATGGDAEKIESAGFDVRNSPTPSPVPEQVLSVNVFLTTTPGHSRITWEPVDRAEGYLVQGSPEPITPASWTQSIVSTKTIFGGNGAIAGQKYWYRVAAFNAAGQGAWSEPALRPVM